MAKVIFSLQKPGEGASFGGEGNGWNKKLRLRHFEPSSLWPSWQRGERRVPYLDSPGFYHIGAKDMDLEAISQRWWLSHRRRFGHMKRS